MKESYETALKDIGGEARDNGEKIADLSGGDVNVAMNGVSEALLGLAAETYAMGHNEASIAFAQAVILIRSTLVKVNAMKAK